MSDRGGADAGGAPDDPEETCACFDCVRRTWLIERMAGHLDQRRGRIADLLELTDEELIGALGGKRRRQLLSDWAGFTDVDAASRVTRASAAGLRLVCRDSAVYPERFTHLRAAAPAVLHVAADGSDGGVARLSAFAAAGTVAVVGTRRPSARGPETARELARGLAAAGATVISGMAIGIDSAAHAGALDAGGATLAVLPGPADRAYPVRETALYARIRARGVVISELAPGAPPRRWSMLARNRLIAALAEVIVVVEGSTRSGALRTLAFGRDLDRITAGMPGPVDSAMARGPNHVIAKQGARLVRGAQDVLDLLYGDGIVGVPAPALPEPTPTEAAVIARIRAGDVTLAALGSEAVVAVAGLELKGWLRRGSGGVLLLRQEDRQGGL